MSEIKPCPFCGTVPIFPEVKDAYGTCYEAGCEDCGIATISIQIIDCFDYVGKPNREDAHNSWNNEKRKYGDDIIKVAADEAFKQWNDRC